ncbi:MAG: ATP-binding protein [Spirochaetaceae bacterium]|nr:ATP-binding protein [Spirochaetaceae bacterium]
MVYRTEYMKKLDFFKDKRLIKVVTGIRRCGKSTLLEMFQEKLLSEGVPKERIISLNLDEPENSLYLDWELLYEYIKERLVPGSKNYIFLDEIQLTPNFERAVNGLFLKRNIDIYLSGSNAKMLSSEISTLLAGRYIEISMLPLSFKEFCSVKKSGAQGPDYSRLYTEYLVNSSFPYTLELEGNYNYIRDYLAGIYNTVILKDIIERKKISDAMMLESVVSFLFDNIGNLCSTKKIADTMVSSGRKISVHTVEQYLSALSDSYILYKIGRYDLRGKERLKTGDKYYLADVGLRYYLLGSKGADQGRMLENVVYLELQRRGYEIYIGKIDSQEIDFVAIKNAYAEYYQVALTVLDETTLKRELAPLMKINDHNPKHLLTLDNTPPASYKGIRQINVLDWLLQSDLQN